MSNKKQTAVEWLVEQLDKNLDINNSWRTSQYIEQAKEMEKQHIIDAWYIGIEKEGKEHGHTFLWHRKDLAEQYYNETYEIE
jgi:3-mercaptopyruvate sulfurtransferase SseA